MNTFSEERSAEVVAASFANTPDDRLREILGALVEHLHAFVKEVELTEAEWATAIDFLTRTGQTCDANRQEFILLSDVLGVSMLVETINHRAGGTGTESTVLGPFHMVESPPRELGDDIALDGKGAPCLVRGRVTGPDGEPIPGASVDAWQANDEGFYDVQQKGIQPDFNLRGVFRTNEDGTYWFQGVKPKFYPIPDDGPVGQLLGKLGRHPFRPAHLHFIVEAAGYDRLTTHIFDPDDQYISSDTVFGVKESLLAEFKLTDDPERAEQLGVANPFYDVEFDFALARASDTKKVNAPPVV